MHFFSQRPHDRDTTASETLLEHEKPNVDDWEATLPISPRRTSRQMLAVMISPYILLISLAIYTLILHHRIATNPTRYTQTVYSPAEKVLQSEVKIFELGFDDGIHDETTVYQGTPSPELDARWKALYKPSMTKVNRQIAARLPNRTAILPHQADDDGDERGYVVMLDVFHQLHCLNMIREALYPSYYKAEHAGEDGEDELLGFHHVDHCVDSIRQSLMCSVDVTPLVWQWSEERNKYLEKAQVPHVCRNFEAVYEWASEHAMHEHFDVAERQWNDPLDESTWR